MRLATLVGILFLEIIVPRNCQADEVQLIANGITYHFDRDSSRNESNWGLGVYYRFDHTGMYQPFLTASSFKDSYNNNSNYVGGGYQRRFQLSSISPKTYFDAGLMGFAMTRKNYRDGKPFLGVLPFASFGNDKLAVNLTYVPHMKFNESSLVFVQFMFHLGNF